MNAKHRLQLSNQWQLKREKYISYECTFLLFTLFSSSLAQSSQLAGTCLRFNNSTFDRAKNESNKKKDGKEKEDTDFCWIYVSVLWIYWTYDVVSMRFMNSTNSQWILIQYYMPRFDVFLGHTQCTHIWYSFICFGYCILHTSKMAMRDAHHSMHTFHLIGDRSDSQSEPWTCVTLVTQYAEEQNHT